MYFLILRKSILKEFIEIQKNNLHLSNQYRKETNLKQKTQFLYIIFTQF